MTSLIRDIQLHSNNESGHHSTGSHTNTVTFKMGNHHGSGETHCAFWLGKKCIICMIIFILDIGRVFSLYSNFRLDRADPSVMRSLQRWAVVDHTHLRQKLQERGSSCRVWAETVPWVQGCFTEHLLARVFIWAGSSACHRHDRAQLWKTRSWH